MHVAINAHLLNMSGSYRDAGVSRYIYHLLRNLIQQYDKEKWTVFGPPGSTAEELCGPGQTPPPGLSVRQSRLDTSRPINRIFWEQAIAPFALGRLNPDVLLCPLNIMPLLSPCPAVVVIHDLAFIRFKVHRASKRAYLTSFTRLSARRAAHLITVSEFTRNEVIELLGVSPSRVTAIPNGNDDRFAPAPPQVVERFRAANHLPPRFLLFVGTLEPRKNIATLIRAYAKVRDRINMPLIIGGGRGWLFDDVFALLRSLGLERDVQFRGFLPNEELPLYYAAATAFAFPSLYEGFGLPPLEAMAVGTPVVVSNAASLPEVVGDAALMVPPLDVDALAEALLRVTTDEILRRDLRKRGLERARLFSWAKTADATMAVLREQSSRKQFNGRNSINLSR